MGQLTLGRAARWWLLATAIFCAATLAIGLHAASAHAARGFDTGIYEPDFTSSNAATQTQAFDHAKEARAGSVIVYVDWSTVAPYTKPAGFVGSNPADPSYDWSQIDAAVRN